MIQQGFIDSPPLPPHDIGQVSRIGLFILVIFFVGLGSWSVFAPLNGAVVANGVIKVEGNRKSLQHLDGGIVKELRVKEGDHVRAGEILIVLDDSQVRSEYDVYNQKWMVLRAIEERLKAELAQESRLEMSESLQPLMMDPVFQEIWSGQILQFNARLTARIGLRQVIKEKIAQLEAQIPGLQAQLKAYKAQLASVKKEKDILEPLFAEGLVTAPRYLQMERSGDGLEGQSGETQASIAKIRLAINEQLQQMAQLDHERMTEMSKELRDIQAQILDVVPRLTNAKAVLSRMEITSPYSGQVVGLMVFSVGGVIGRGEKILDIVPNEEALIIETQIDVNDISDIHLNMEADVHLNAYKARTTPVIHGIVTYISADRLTDNRTGVSYYNAFIHVDHSEVEALSNIRMYPGMQVTVMFTTIARSAFDYLVGPLRVSFNHAFRQK
ncbi:MAG: HlyD family type I secretion periplasmic adaptor subunit [Magnetococcus sp. DMHC-6]